MRVHRRRHTRSTIPTLSLLTALAGFAATLPTPHARDRWASLDGTMRR